MARALIITDAKRAEIAALIEKASQTPMPLDAVERAARYRDKVGPTPNEYNDVLTIGIPRGFRVTYSHEQQPGAMCRHISISIDDLSGKYGPSRFAVDMILQAFGFVNRVGRIIAWDEHLPDGRLVINCVEPLDGDLSKLLRK